MQIRVYYEDTDCGNIVYYANYLKFMERSRTEHFRDRGIDLAHWMAKGVQFVVIEAHLKYRNSARYNDLLDVDSELTDLSFASITFSTSVYRQKGPLLVKGEVRLACVDLDNHIKRIPDEIREMLGWT